MVCGNCPHKIELGKNARKIQKASKEIAKVAPLFKNGVWRSPNEVLGARTAILYLLQMTPKIITILSLSRAYLFIFGPFFSE